MCPAVNSVDGERRSVYFCQEIVKIRLLFIFDGKDYPFHFFLDTLLTSNQTRCPFIAVYVFDLK